MKMDYNFSWYKEKLIIKDLLDCLHKYNIENNLNLQIHDEELKGIAHKFTRIIGAFVNEPNIQNYLVKIRRKHY